jgi:hypothetical protein
VSFDEASGIDDSIYNVTEGFFTDLSPLRIWVLISNGRKNTGEFFEAFHKNQKTRLALFVSAPQQKRRACPPTSSEPHNNNNPNQSLTESVTSL